jgi:CRP-like cAMP-binding protein
MPLDTYLSFLSQIHPLSDECLGEVHEVLSLKQYPKKHFLVKQGETVDEVFFITKGCVREFFTDDNTDEICTWFGFEHDIALPTHGFLIQQPSFTSIQAIEDVEAVILKRGDLENLYQKYHELERVGRILAEMYLIQNEENRIILQTYNAKQKYEFLIKKHPETIQRIPLSYIASYLGISLETLSRIRARK